MNDVKSMNKEIGSIEHLSKAETDRMTEFLVSTWNVFLNTVAILVIIIVVVVIVCSAGDSASDSDKSRRANNEVQVLFHSDIPSCLSV